MQQHIELAMICRSEGRTLARVIAIVDICLDLGIVPAQMDRATSEELCRAIILYSGNLGTLVLRRLRSQDPAASAGFIPTPVAWQPTIVFPTWPAPSPQVPVLACTGPPRTWLPWTMKGPRPGPAHGQPRRPDSAHDRPVDTAAVTTSARGSAQLDLSAGCYKAKAKSRCPSG